jgi:hypothetical protein
MKPGDEWRDNVLEMAIMLPDFLRLELVPLELREGLDRKADRGIADQHMDRPEAVLHLRDHRPHLRLVARIGSHGKRLAASLRDLIDDRECRAYALKIVDRHRRALGGKKQRRCATDPPARACNQCNFAFHTREFNFLLILQVQAINTRKRIM